MFTDKRLTFQVYISCCEHLYEKLNTHYNLKHHKVCWKFLDYAKRGNYDVIIIQFDVILVCTHLHFCKYFGEDDSVSFYFKRKEVISFL